MPASRFLASPRGRPAFLDRVDESRLVRQHIELLGADSTHFKVFEILGLGGVGKTRFLAEIRDRSHEASRRTTLVWVSLESEAAATATGPLRVIRNQLGFDCLLFDSALLSYWTATGQPFQSVGGRGRGASFAFRSVEVSGGLAGIPLPLTFAADVFDGVARAVTRRHRYRRAEFEAIDEFRQQPSELYTRLPHYLGLDMKRRATAKRHFAVFYDAYEKQSAETIARDAPWLREFIATVGSGVHVISTRDRVLWDAQEWSGVLQVLVLGELPEVNCRELVRAELGDVSTEVEDHLVQSSHRIPFFLQAAIDVCRSRIDTDAAVRASDLPTSPETVVDHLIDHLDRGERTLAVALASVEYFDEALYAYLVRSLNLRLSVVDIEEFAEWFFVERVQHGLYKTHDLLTECVRGSRRFRPTVVQALQAASEHLALRVAPGDADDPEKDLQLFHALLAGWQPADSLPISVLEILIDIGYRFYDAGYWQALTDLPAASGNTSKAAAFPAQFFAALAARRMQGAERALALLEPLEPMRWHIGRHLASFDLEVAYLSEILGNYGRAREEFATLMRRVEPFDPMRRDHLRSRLYHADMLTMDGEFASASRRLLESYELIGPEAAVDWAEFVRHRAHAYRFSLIFDQAEHLYLQALRFVEEAPSMRGKLFCNLVETRCWLSPYVALQDAERAMQFNADLSNHLEVAKCEAATSIALAQIGDIESARATARRSLQHSGEIGYPAGVAFALQARVLVEVVAGDLDEADTAYLSLTRVVESLGTYGHLCVVAAYLRGDEQEVVRWSDGVDWLGAATLTERLGSLRLVLM